MSIGREHFGSGPTSAGRPRLAVTAGIAALIAAIALASAIALIPSGASRSGGGSVAAAGHGVRLTLHLRLRTQAVRRAVRAVEDPASARFRHFLSPQAFGDRFGLPPARRSELRRLLARAGLRVLDSYPQATAMTVAGSTAAVSRLLGVPAARYRAEESRWVSAGHVRVPGSLAPFVTSITLPAMSPHWQPRDVPKGGLLPVGESAAYNVTPLHRAGILGQGETIAILSYSDYIHTDPAVFAKKFGLSGPEPTIIPVQGGTVDRSGSSEANLDIDVIRSIAPAAHILFYLARNGGTGEGAIVRQIVGEHRASIVSDSWGTCLPRKQASEIESDEEEFLAARKMGVSVFVAAGDAGAYDCRDRDRSNHELAVDWPAASSGVVAVGGTRLYVDAHNAYIRETAWEGAFSRLGGGGGEAAAVPRPAWQSAPGLGKSVRGRQLPDVSAAADLSTGFITYETGQGFRAGNGTSQAAPFWAAVTALIDQYARMHGVGGLGFINPVLYRIASTPQPHPPFHDVTVGANLHYGAGVGWDAATGLGSPDVYNLARDVVRYLRARHR